MVVIFIILDRVFILINTASMIPLLVKRIGRFVYCFIDLFQVSVLKPLGTLYTCKSVTDPHYSVLDPDGQGR